MKHSNERSHEYDVLKKILEEQCKSNHLLERMLEAQCKCDHVLEHILEVERAIHIDIHRIVHILQPQLTRSVAVHFTTGDMLVQTNNLSFNVGDTSTASLATFLADGTSPSNGVVSGVTWNFSDSSATLVPSTDGLTAVITGVAASPGPISGSVAFTVTDTDGVVSQWNQQFTIQTNGGQPPEQLTQSVAVQFSDPVPAGGGAATSRFAPNAAKRPLNE